MMAKDYLLFWMCLVTHYHPNASKCHHDALDAVFLFLATHYRQCKQVQNYLRNPSMLRQVSHVSQILPGITFNIGRGTHMC